MLFFPITEVDLKQRHPDLAADLWDSQSTLIGGTANKFEFVAGKFWSLTDDDKTFVSADIGKLIIIEGFFCGIISEIISTTKIKLKLERYPVEIEESDCPVITTDGAVDYSIAGYSKQILAAMESIIMDFTNKGIYPEAIYWSDRNIYQLEPIFVVKTMSIIFRDLLYSDTDRWYILWKNAEEEYKYLINNCKILYEKEKEEKEISAEYKISEIKVRR